MHPIVAQSGAISCGLEREVWLICWVSNVSLTSAKRPMSRVVLPFICIFNQSHHCCVLLIFYCAGWAKSSCIPRASTLLQWGQWGSPIYSDIHSMDPKTVGCWTSHKYTNIYNFYSVKYYKHFAKRYYRSPLHTNRFVYRVRGLCFSIFLMVLCNLPCHAWGLWDWVVNCWKFLCQHKMYFVENTIVWHSVSENGAYSVY